MIKLQAAVVAIALFLALPAGAQIGEFNATAYHIVDTSWYEGFYAEHENYGGTIVQIAGWAKYMSFAKQWCIKGNGTSRSIQCDKFFYQNCPEGYEEGPLTWDAETSNPYADWSGFGYVWTVCGEEPEA